MEQSDTPQINVVETTSRIRGSHLLNLWETCRIRGGTS